MIECPKCQCEYGYSDGMAFHCPECAHSWTEVEEEKTSEPEKEQLVLDAVGNELQDGDDVSINLDLTIGKDTLKRGTKVKGISLLDQPVDDHDIAAKIKGFGQVYLKSSVVKKIK